jgi:hypothetical protein
VFLTAVTYLTVEQRMNTIFFKLGKTPIEIYELFQSVCSNEALGSSSGFDWFKRFKDGREYLQGEPRSGRLSTSRNADTIAYVLEMVT